MGTQISIERLKYLLKKVMKSRNNWKSKYHDLKDNIKKEESFELDDKLYVCISHKSSAFGEAYEILQRYKRGNDWRTELYKEYRKSQKKTI